MIAIFTKFLGPTATKPSRIVAYTTNGDRLCQSKSKLEDQAERIGRGDLETVHQLAAQALADKMHWTGNLITGGYDKGYVHVLHKG